MTYTVVGLLGRGGMAVVELAVDEEGRQVARKRVSLSGSAQQIAMARHRIRREAEVLATLHHPGIVPLLAVEDDGADLVMVMPRMAASLADRVERFGPMATAEVAAVAAVLLDALATAHRQGVVHRDIKPANVLFDAAGRPALADFGVATARHFTPGLTVAGTVVGTPEFIAPEQAAGRPATAASDIFSLGATLAYAVSGHGPYGEGPPLALMNRAARGEIAPLPPGLPAAVAAFLDPRPERRPTAAAALGGPNGTMVDHLPAKKPGSGKKVALVAGLLIAILAMVVAGVDLYQHTEASAPAPAPAKAPVSTPITTACTPQLYQPCGQASPDFGTDGRTCLPGHADYDGILANGCEAVSDYQPGRVITGGQPVAANLVPANAVDTYQANVAEHFYDLCLDTFKVTITAPPGTTDQVQILRGGDVLATATSADLESATASASKPSCFDNGSAMVTIQVSAVAGQSAEDFRLITSGSW